MAAGAIATLHSPDPSGHAANNAASPIALRVGTEPTRPQQLPVMVEHLDRHRQLVRIDTDHHTQS